MRGRPVQWNSKSGFTITEALVASTILAVSLGAVLQALWMSRRSAEMATRQVAAMHQARGVLEDLTSSVFTDSRLNVGRYTFSGGYYDVSQVSGDTRSKNIDVRVRWISPGRARTNEVSLFTSISQTLHK